MAPPVAELSRLQLLGAQRLLRDGLAGELTDEFAARHLGNLTGNNRRSMCSVGSTGSGSTGSGSCW